MYMKSLKSLAIASLAVVAVQVLVPAAPALAQDAYLVGVSAAMTGRGSAGYAPVAEAIRLAVGTVLSGPAGGVAGARHAAALTGVNDLIPFDRGGPSTDISLIVEGRPTLAGGRDVVGQRIALPSLDIVTLGAGGGSIAAVDRGGILQVGPQSAGAVPGPACYGKGGAEPTVTDANLVLGRLNPESIHRYRCGAGNRPREIRSVH